MIIPFILVCLSGTPDCNIETALRISAARPVDTMAQCLLAGQLKLASESRALEVGDQIVIKCVRQP